MADAGVRTLKITGDAADYFQRLKGGKRSRGPTRKAQRPLASTQRGGDAPPGESLTSAKNYANAGKLVANAGKVLKGGGDSGAAPAAPSNTASVAATAVANPRLSMPGVASGPVGAAAQAPTPATQAAAAAGNQSGGGSTTKKLVLAPAKKKSRKVVLAPSGASGHKKSSASTAADAAPGKTRKIRVQLSGLKKRLTKAKTIHKDSREKPIAEVRKLLEEAKLIKPASAGKTVPDTVLRDIYKDYLLLRNRAL